MAVGSLMYAMLGTRPAIVYAVGLVSQFKHALHWDHWVPVKRIFQYLAATKEFRLRYGTSNHSGGYRDAGGGSGEDQKSIGGFFYSCLTVERYHGQGRNRTLLRC